MKKIIVLLLVTAFSLCACGASNNASEPVESAKGIDLASMSYDELVDLHSRITQILQQDQFIEQFNEKMGDTLLFENDDIEVRFSDLYVETPTSDSYMELELLFKNKTNEEIYFVCEELIINGCTIDISKYVEVPANTVYLNKWTKGEDGILQKYGIDTIETLEITFAINHGEKIRSQTVKLQDFTIEYTK